MKKSLELAYQGFDSTKFGGDEQAYIEKSEQRDLVQKNVMVTGDSLYL